MNKSTPTVGKWRRVGKDIMDKAAIQKQWDGDPCGANTVDSALVPSSVEYYREARFQRYGIYAPWIAEAVGFSSFKNTDILEIGVGLGSDHYSFASQGNRMTALDLSRAHLTHTVRHLRFEGLKTNAVYGDAEYMPFNNDCFDMVYAFGVLHHTPDTERAIAEVFRVLRPGGVAIITLYSRWSLFFLIFLLRNGLLRGGFFKKSYPELLSEIEYRSGNNDAVPIVKLYSRAEIRRLFIGFERTQIATNHCTLGKYQLNLPWSRGTQELVVGYFGWYHVVKAWK